MSKIRYTKRELYKEAERQAERQAWAINLKVNTEKKIGRPLSYRELLEVQDFENRKNIAMQLENKCELLYKLICEILNWQQMLSLKS